MYIREAHPADSNWGDGSGVVDPTSLVDRSAVAKTCTRELKLSLPTVVDGLDDHVNMLYRAWPERIYVIDRTGVIRHKSGIGPFGFDPDAAMHVATGLLSRTGKRRRL